MERVGRGPDSVTAFADLDALQRKGDFKEFQAAGVEWLQLHGGGMVQVPCGGGKTWIAIGWLASRPPSERILVVTSAPGVFQWVGELADLLPSYPVRVVEDGSRCTVRHTGVRALSKGMPEWHVLERATKRVLEWVPDGAVPHDYLMDDDEIATQELLHGSYVDADSPPIEVKHIRRADAIMLARKGKSPQEIADWLKTRRGVEAAPQGIAAFLGQYTARRVALLHQRTLEDESPGIVLVSCNILTMRRDALAAWCPDSIIFDESHHFKHHKTRVVVGGSDEERAENEKPIFDWAETQSGSAAMLARVAQRAVLLTATPEPDRVRDWHAQLSLIELYRPWMHEYGSGSFYPFAAAYCNGHEGAFGYDSTGASNLPELVARLNRLRYKVPASVALAGLAEPRTTIYYVSKEKLARGILREEDRAAYKALAKQPKGRLQFELCHLAMRKRPTAMGVIEEALSAGEKVLAVTGWQHDCETLGAEVKELAAKLDEKRQERGKAHADSERPARMDKPTKVWVAHAELSSATERRAIQMEYMAYDGPAIIVGTLDSWGECVAPDTLLVGSDKPIADHRAGDVTYSSTALTEVRGAKSRHFQGEMVEVRGCGLLPLAATPNHALLVLEGVTGRKRGVLKRVLLPDAPVWKRIDEVQTWSQDPSCKSARRGDFLLLPRLKGVYTDVVLSMEPVLGASAVKTRRRRGLPCTLPLDADVAWAMGLYAAEGSAAVSKKGSIDVDRAHWSLCADEGALAERVMRIFHHRGFPAT